MKPPIYVAMSATETPHKVSHIAQMAELLGYHGFMLADTLNRDTYALQALCASLTRRMRIGPSVTNPFSRHPVVTASAALTIDEISNGRMILGIGAGGKEKRIFTGPGNFKPAIALREAVTIIRKLWRGEEISFHGAYFSLDNFRFRLERPHNIPILISSVSPMIQNLAGEVADAAMVGHTLISRSSYRRHMRNVAGGARRAKRKLEDVQLLPYLYTCCSRDKERARDSVRLVAARGLIESVESSAIDPGEAGATHERVRKIEKMMKQLPVPYYLQYSLPKGVRELVSEDIVDSFSVSGTPDECASKVRRILGYGFNSAQLYLVPVMGHSDRYLGYIETLESFAEAWFGQSVSHG